MLQQRIFQKKNPALVKNTRRNKPEIMVKESKFQKQNGIRKETQIYHQNIKQPTTTEKTKEAKEVKKIRSEKETKAKGEEHENSTI